MEKKIAILLPYKEKYTQKDAAAASIWVKDYLKIYKEFPDNLLVRVSAPMIDGKPLKFRWQEGILYKWTSTVHHKQKAIGHDCPSRFQENKCKSCRACWDRNIKNVSYHKH